MVLIWVFGLTGEKRRTLIGPVVVVRSMSRAAAARESGCIRPECRRKEGGRKDNARAREAPVSKATRTATLGGKLGVFRNRRAQRLIGKTWTWPSSRPLSRSCQLPLELTLHYVHWSYSSAECRLEASCSSEAAATCAAQKRVNSGGPASLFSPAPVHSCKRHQAGSQDERVQLSVRDVLTRQRKSYEPRQALQAARMST